MGKGNWFATFKTTGFPAAWDLLHSGLYIHANSRKNFYPNMPLQYHGEISMKFKIVLEPSSEGGYTAYVPSLLGCISEGDTIEESLDDIREAIDLYLEPVEGFIPNNF